MGLSGLYDETVGQYCSACIDSRKTVEVGVLIGRATGGRVGILKLAPTPPQEGSPAVTFQQGAAPGAASNTKKQGAKAKAAQPGGGLSIDKEWVVEHAAQVLGMLPGGLAVVGLYVLCPEGAFAGASGQLLSLLHEAQTELEAQGQGFPNNSEFLVLHVDSVTGKLAAREFTGGAAGALRPCDLKPSNLLAGLVAVHCRLDAALTVQLANSKQRLRDALSAAVERELQQRVQRGVGLLAGQAQPSDTLLLDIPATGSGSDAAAGPHIELELLLPPPAASPGLLISSGSGGEALQRGRGQQEVAGGLQLSGVLDCRAYLQKREPAAAAVEAIKQDAARTLRSRVRVLAELAEQQQEEAGAAGQGPQQQTGAPPLPPPLLLQRVGEQASAVGLALPRRVFIPGPGGAFCFCDHLMEGEGPESVPARAEELLGSAAGDASAVQCLEAVPAPAGKRSGGAGAGSRSAAAASAFYCNAVAVGAAATAGVALLLGYLSLGQQ